MKNYLKKSILIHFQIELENQEVQISWPSSAWDCTCDVVELLETNDGEGMPQLLVTWVQQWNNVNIETNNYHANSHLRLTHRA